LNYTLQKLLQEFTLSRKGKKVDVNKTKTQEQKVKDIKIKEKKKEVHEKIIPAANSVELMTPSKEKS